MIYNLVKRIIDLMVSSLGLITLLPLLISIAFIIKWESKGPILYRGERVGLNKHLFQIFKFRTMVENAEFLGGLVTSKNDTRVTRIGSILRKYKIDEIPQLFNILRGDMSLVGPRPEVTEFTSLYKKEEEIIFSVKPGLTDFSSIEFVQLGETLGNNSNKRFEEEVNKVLRRKIELRIKYVLERSFLVDIKILIMTVKKLISINR